MFTGVIKTLGVVEKLRVNSKSAVVVVRRPSRWRVKVGDSIAVQGVCSTVSALSAKSFTFNYMPETLKLTTIRHWKVGGQVQLEQSLRWGDRLDGHLVFGHVDTVGVVKSIKKEGNSFVLTVTPVARGDLRLAAKKGSVAIDGVSLTITAVTKNNFSVSLVPYTWEHTTLRGLKVGDRVNIEWDMVAKYVAQLRKFAV